MTFQVHNENHANQKMVCFRRIWAKEPVIQKKKSQKNTTSIVACVYDRDSPFFCPGLLDPKSWEIRHFFLHDSRRCVPIGHGIFRPVSSSFVLLQNQYWGQRSLSSQIEDTLEEKKWCTPLSYVTRVN